MSFMSVSPHEKIETYLGLRARFRIPSAAGVRTVACIVLQEARFKSCTAPLQTSSLVMSLKVRPLPKGQGYACCFKQPCPRPEPSILPELAAIPSPSYSAAGQWCHDALFQLGQGLVLFVDGLLGLWALHSRLAFLRPCNAGDVHQPRIRFPGRIMVCHLIVIHVTYHPPEGGQRALLRDCIFQSRSFYQTSWCLLISATSKSMSIRDKAGDVRRKWPMRYQGFVKIAAANERGSRNISCR